MVRVYWTTIAGTVSATLWSVYLFLNKDTISSGEISLIILFVINLCLLILIREKTY